MFKKISNNLILFGIVAMSFVLTNNASAASDVTYAFSGESTKGYFNDNFNSYSGNNNPYLYDSGYNNYNSNNLNTGSKTGSTSGTLASNTNPTVVNNYYYSTSNPATSTSTKTADSATSKTASTKTVSGTKVASAGNVSTGYYNDVPLAREANSVRSYSGSSYFNNLGASAYGATGYRTVGSFMPNSVWDWILTILLVMAIIVVYRMIVRKARKAKETPKTV